MRQRKLLGISRFFGPGYKSCFFKIYQHQTRGFSFDEHAREKHRIPLYPCNAFARNRTGHALVVPARNHSFNNSFNMSATIDIPNVVG